MESANRVTKGFPIEIPSSKLSASASVFKVHFGKKYFIWKGKSLYQSIEILAKSIMARIRDGNLDDTNQMYHVVEHIKKNGITRGECMADNVFNDYDKEDGTVDGYRMLVDEQAMLDKASKSLYCLNNNIQAYIPENTAYISTKQKERFKVKFEKTHKI
jgi:hypothetical protein